MFTYLLTTGSRTLGGNHAHITHPLSLSESLPEDRAVPKLQALVYDIVRWRKVAESDAESVGSAVVVPLHGL